MIRSRNFVKLSDEDLASYLASELLEEDVDEYRAYLVYRSVFEKVKRDLKSYRQSLRGIYDANEALRMSQYLFAAETMYDAIRCLAENMERDLSSEELLNLAENYTGLESLASCLVTLPSPLFKVSDWRLARLLDSDLSGIKSVTKEDFKDQILEYWHRFETNFLNSKPSDILKNGRWYFMHMHGCIALLRPKEFIGRDFSLEEMKALLYAVKDPLYYIGTTDMSAPTNTWLQMTVKKETV